MVGRQGFTLFIVWKWILKNFQLFLVSSIRIRNFNKDKVLFRSNYARTTTNSLSKRSFVRRSAFLFSDHFLCLSISNFTATVTRNASTTFISREVVPKLLILQKQNLAGTRVVRSPSIPNTPPKQDPFFLWSVSYNSLFIILSFIVASVHCCHSTVVSCIIVDFRYCS